MCAEIRGDPDLIEIAISAEIRSPDDTHLDVQSELRILRNHVMYEEPSGGGAAWLPGYHL